MRYARGLCSFQSIKQWSCSHTNSVTYIYSFRVLNSTQKLLTYFYKSLQLVFVKKNGPRTLYTELFGLILLFGITLSAAKKHNYCNLQVAYPAQNSPSINFIFLQERLLGRILQDYFIIKLIFLEAHIRRRQIRGVSTDPKMAKVRHLKLPPVTGKMVEEYFIEAMNRIFTKLLQVDSIKEEEWLDHW